MAKELIEEMMDFCIGYYIGIQSENPITCVHFDSYIVLNKVI
jgi:hypothetical protein